MTLTLHLIRRLNARRGKTGQIHRRIHPTAPVALSGCFDPTHPRDIRHVPPETFMSSILSRLLSAQRRWAMVLRPKPSNRYACGHCRSTGPSISAPSKVVAEAFRFPRVGDGFAPKPPKCLSPVAMHPNWTPRPRRSLAR